MPAQIQPSGIMPGQRLMVLTEQKKPWSASPSKSVRHVVVDIVPAQLFHEVRDIRLVVDQQTFQSRSSPQNLVSIHKSRRDSGRCDVTHPP